MTQIDEVNEVLHKIEAKLYPNYLGKGEGAYVARAKAEAPLSVEDVCTGAKIRGGFSVHGANDHITVDNLHIAFSTLHYLKQLLLQVKIENKGLAGDGVYIDEIIDMHTDNMIHILGIKSNRKIGNGNDSLLLLNKGDL